MMDAEAILSAALDRMVRRLDQNGDIERIMGAVASNNCVYVRWTSGKPEIVPNEELWARNEEDPQP